MTKPTGTVTFVFTDIEGSTRLLTEIGDAYFDVLTTHNKLLRKAFEDNNGYEFGSEGDALFVSFAHASDAVAAVFEAQCALGAQSWPSGVSVAVRMGLHTGEAHVHEGNYIGLVLHHTARICSAAHGGQVLLSESTCRVAADRLPADVVVRDLGAHNLKDLAEAQHLFQLCHPDLRDDFPALRTHATLPNNLPIQLTTFIGRDLEMAELSSLLEESRLVTLAGTGGAGKTRLAIQVGGLLLDKFDDGVWLVELAAVTDPSFVFSAVGVVLGIREEANRQIKDVLLDWLRPRKLLLILDNCEHLAGACAQLAEDVLQVASNVRILATSREPLGITGETTWRVPSLRSPDPNSVESAEALVQYECVQLFLDRAISASPNFVINQKNASAVAQICHRLDGIPLAIELAAARVKLLTAEQLSARLDDRFRVLTGGSRTALPRQQTLRALVDWSHDLLSEPEQVLLRRLSVFVQGFDIDAAELVCEGHGLESFEILELLGQLVDKSLVVFGEVKGIARYRLLETIRQYALEKLSDADEMETTRVAHRDHHLNLVEQHRQGPGAEFLRTSPEVLALLEREYGNFRAALEWSLSAAPPSDFALRIGNALAALWAHKGLWGEARHLIEGSISIADNSPSALLRAGFDHLAWFSFGKDDEKAGLSAQNEALKIGRALGDHATVAKHLANLARASYRTYDMGEFSRLLDEALVEARLADQSLVNSMDALVSVLMHQSRLPLWIGASDEALVLLEEGLTVSRKSDVVDQAIGTLITIAAVQWGRGKFDEARRLLDESNELAAEKENVALKGMSLVYLASFMRCTGDLDSARGYALEALSLLRGTEAMPRMFLALCELTSIDLDRDEADSAEFWAKEAEGLAGRFSSSSVGLALHNLGRVAARKDDRVAARRLLAEAYPHLSGPDTMMERAACLLDLGTVALDDGELTEAGAQFTQALALFGMAPFGVGSVSLALERLGELSIVSGDLRVGAEILGCIEAERERCGIVSPSDSKARVARALALAKSELGEAVWKETHQAGRNISPDTYLAPAIQELASEALQLGEVGGALSAYARAAEKYYEVGDSAGSAECLRIVARCFAESAVADRAVQLLAVIDGLGVEGDPEFTEELRLELGTDFEGVWEKGAALSLTGAVRAVMADPLSGQSVSTMSESPFLPVFVPLRTNTFK